VRVKEAKMADDSDSMSSGASKPGSAANDSAFERLLSEVASTPQPNLLLEGALVGEYRLVKQLGKGTFGTVYHGAHAVIGKQAALKVLNAQFSGDPRAVGRFIDEARAVNRIAHPNIVDIFGFGALADGRKYCVMELLEGETLAAFLGANQGPCSWPQAATILTQVAAALDAAHDSNVVHRDLKPDNIFIAHKPLTPGGEQSWRVKLLDFGIARIADSSHANTESGAVLGTPAYMSPEQCRGAQVDRRTDVYALGVVAFQMLTGKPLFSGENALQLIAQQINDVAPLPSHLNPKLPPAVDAVFTRLLAKLPEQRPERASAAVSELLRALGQREPGAVVAAMPRPARGSRWRPLLIVVGAVGLLGAVSLALRARAPTVKATASQASAIVPTPRTESTALPTVTSASTPPSPTAQSAPPPAPSARPPPKPTLAKHHANHELEY
jgi:serine/threonine-protein kinase